MAEYCEMDNYDMRSFQAPLLTIQYYDNINEDDWLAGIVACVEEKKIRHAMYIKHNIDSRSYNHCCSGKAISITYSECVFLALGIRHGWTGWRSRYSYWLRAERSGDLIPVETRFSATVQTGPGAHPASCKMGTRSFPGVKSGRVVPFSAVVKKE